MAAVFLRLGCTSFGGPVAHLGYLRTECVEKRQWLDDAHYADLVALCQFLPGPASSQVVFALGQHRAGLAGALVASVCFTLPSAVLMVGFALGLSWLGDLQQSGWLHGLKLAAVPVVAQAVMAMGKKLCPDLPRAVGALLAAGALVAFPSLGAQLLVMLLGAALGWLRYQRTIPAPSPAVATTGHHAWAAGALGTFAALLLVLPALARTFDTVWLAAADAFYRAGALVFGGGHVVLALLRQAVVPRGWLSDEAFLAGYGAAQAVPGPLFTFAAYVGTAMFPGPLAWVFGVWCLLWIFVPAWLLVGGALPFWQRLRSTSGAQAAMAGANAAVVGVLLAALWNPVITTSVRGPGDAAAAMAGLVLLEWVKVPAWAVVVLAAALGHWVL